MDDSTPVAYERDFPVEHCDPDAIHIVERLNRAGYDAYLVGGCVRDLLLGRMPKDFDIATSARPRQVKRLLPRSRIIGRRFRLVHARSGGKVFEISTFRRENPGGKLGALDPELDPDDQDAELIVDDNIFGTPAEDARRRDLTINALFYDIRTHRVIDYVGGLQDIEARRVRTIGDPETRFREDPIRILRAIRFAGTLGLEMDRGTARAISHLRHSVLKGAPPRIYQEFERTFLAHSGAAVFDLLIRSRVLEVVLPEIASVVEEDLSAFFHTGESRTLSTGRHLLAAFQLLDRADAPLVYYLTFLFLAPVRVETLRSLGLDSHGRVATDEDDLVESDLAQAELAGIDLARLAPSVLGSIARRFQLQRKLFSAALRLILNQKQFLTSEAPEEPAKKPRRRRRKKRSSASRFIRSESFADSLLIHRIDRLAAGDDELESFHAWVAKAHDTLGNVKFLPPSLEIDALDRIAAAPMRDAADSQGDTYPMATDKLPPEEDPTTSAPLEEADEVEASEPVTADAGGNEHGDGDDGDWGDDDWSDDASWDDEETGDDEGPEEEDSDDADEDWEEPEADWDGDEESEEDDSEEDDSEEDDDEEEADDGFLSGIGVDEDELDPVAPHEAAAPKRRSPAPSGKRRQWKTKALVPAGSTSGGFGDGLDIPGTEDPEEPEENENDWDDGDLGETEAADEPQPRDDEDSPEDDWDEEVPAVATDDESPEDESEDEDDEEESRPRRRRRRRRRRPAAEERESEDDEDSSDDSWDASQDSGDEDEDDSEDEDEEERPRRKRRRRRRRPSRADRPEDESPEDEGEEEDEGEDDSSDDLSFAGEQERDDDEEEAPRRRRRRRRRSSRADGDDGRDADEEDEAKRDDDWDTSSESEASDSDDDDDDDDDRPRRRRRRRRRSRRDDEVELGEAEEDSDEQDDLDEDDDDDFDADLEDRDDDDDDRPRRRRRRGRRPAASRDDDDDDAEDPYEGIKGLREIIMSGVFSAGDPNAKPGSRTRRRRRRR